jgi:MerR family mercuric resistance operon transcriptional regulator
MAFTAAGHFLKRGVLAKRFGCNIETIRHYENIALLPAPGRTESRHRVYSPSDQARLGFILRARELGFSVDEVRSLLIPNRGDPDSRGDSQGGKGVNLWWRA